MKKKKNYYLSQFVIASFVISSLFSVAALQCYFSHIYKDSEAYVHLFISCSTLYFISFTLLYIKKKRQQKITTQ